MYYETQIALRDASLQPVGITELDILAVFVLC